MKKRRSSLSLLRNKAQFSIKGEMEIYFSRLEKELQKKCYLTPAELKEFIDNSIQRDFQTHSNLGRQKNYQYSRAAKDHIFQYYLACLMCTTKK